jgi:hypothetical protein
MESTRYHFLDWLRVLAIALLLFFHTGMLLVGWRWHLTNSESLRAGRHCTRYTGRRPVRERVHVAVARSVPRLGTPAPEQLEPVARLVARGELPDELVFGVTAARAEWRASSDHEAPVAEPKTWLLRVGYRGRRKFDVDEVPGARRYELKD